MQEFTITYCFCSYDFHDYPINIVKIIFSKKATKIDKIFNFDLTVTTYTVKLTVKILLFFVAFSENVNFNTTLWSVNDVAAINRVFACCRAWTKGQLISKCPFGVTKLTKKTNKDFCPSHCTKRRSNQKISVSVRESK